MTIETIIIFLLCLQTSIHPHLSQIWNFTRCASSGQSHLCRKYQPGHATPVWSPPGLSRCTEIQGPLPQSVWPCRKWPLCHFGSWDSACSQASLISLTLHWPFLFSNHTELLLAVCLEKWLSLPVCLSLLCSILFTNAYRISSPLPLYLPPREIGHLLIGSLLFIFQIQNSTKLSIDLPAKIETCSVTPVG